jgi:hypothetical protein
MFRSRAKAGDPESWSIWDPMFLGIDERGQDVRVGLTGGAGWLIAEGTTPQRMKTAYLTDDQTTRITDHAAHLHTRAAITAGTRDGEGAA